jgi:hypothetical protein
MAALLLHKMGVGLVQGMFILSNNVHNHVPSLVVSKAVMYSAPQEEAVMVFSFFDVQETNPELRGYP